MSATSPPETPTTSAAPAETTEVSFEDILGKIEALVSKLEGGKLPLEEALQRFEEGMALARQGNQRLEAAKLRIEELNRDNTRTELKVDE